MLIHLDYLSQLFKETVVPVVGEADIYDPPVTGKQCLNPFMGIG
jgi:hypothetical protein